MRLQVKQPMKEFDVYDLLRRDNCPDLGHLRPEQLESDINSILSFLCETVDDKYEPRFAWATNLGRFAITYIAKYSEELARLQKTDHWAEASGSISFFYDHDEPDEFGLRRVKIVFKYHTNEQIQKILPISIGHALDYLNKKTLKMVSE